MLRATGFRAWRPAGESLPALRRGESRGEFRGHFHSRPFQWWKPETVAAGTTVATKRSNTTGLRRAAGNAFNNFTIPPRELQRIYKSLRPTPYELLDSRRTVNTGAVGLPEGEEEVGF